MENCNGILCIRKEQGMTSHDVVFKLRKILKTKKIGHSGTLDPMATGVLLVLVGKATKILPYLENTDKEYIAEMKLGIQTTTEDIWGEVIEEKPIEPIADFNALCQSFVGKSQQLPPMVSSIKVNGKKLYEYARNNEPVERPLRDIEIYEIEVLGDLKFRVSCGSGTYVRSLCRDMALKSGNIGCMTSLVRTKVGALSIDQSYTLEDVEKGNFELLSIESALSHMKVMELDDDFDVKNGKRIHIDTDQDWLLMKYKGEAIAIYKRSHKDVFGCERGLR